VKRVGLWKVKGDNPIAASAPHFTGDHSVLLNLYEEADTVEHFGALITFKFLDMIVHESNCFAVRKKWQ
jgi:hypothetical protein